MEKEKSRIFLVIPIYLYSINILYATKDQQINGYSLSTIMLKKQDVLNFFKHLNFKTLEQQKEEDKKEQKFNIITRLFTIVAFIIVIIAFLIFMYYKH